MQRNVCDLQFFLYKIVCQFFDEDGEIDLIVFVPDISSQVKWAEYINNIVFPPNSERKITDEDRITCSCVASNFKCFEYLQELRALVNSSTRRVVANYIGWR